MSTTITATATEPVNELTAPTPGGDTDTWGEILNEQTLVTILAYILWLKENLGEGGAEAFTDLSDAPSSYAGAGGKVVAVKATEDGLEFITASGGVAGSFTDLGDTPASYASAGGQYVRVNATPDGLEFHQLTEGFEKMRVVDESTYAGLTPDEDTIYFIEADT